MFGKVEIRHSDEPEGFERDLHKQKLLVSQSN